MSNVFLGLVDMSNPPDGYDKYIWSCDGCVKGIHWCAEHKKKYEVLPNPWKNEDEVDNAIRYLKEVRIRVLNSLKREIGEYLNVNYGDDEWFILLSTWIREYLTSCYDKYIRLKMIEKANDLMDCYIYNTTFSSPQVDHADFFSLSASSDSYNLLLYSELIYNLQADLQNIAFREISTEQIKPNVLNSHRKPLLNLGIRLLNVMGSICRYFSCDNILVNMKSTGIGYRLMFRFILKSRVFLLPLYTPYKEIKNKLIRPYIDNEWRESPLSLNSCGDTFVDAIKKSIKKDIPIAYVEAHKTLKRYVDRCYKNLTHTQAYLSGAAFIYDELDRLLLLEMRRNDKGLCGFQHGGNYGVEKYWLHEDEFQVYKRYYTWGWDRKAEPDKFIPMPSFFLTRSRKFQVKKTNRILYVSYTRARYVSRFSRMEIYYKELIKEGEIQFLKSLSDEMRSRLTVRLFPEDYGWNCRESIINEIPDIVFDKELSLRDSADKVSLVITCDWQTVFIEMLALGKPVLVLCDGSFIINEAKHEVELLHEVGIAHKCWESIRMKIEEIDGKVQEWWEEPVRQMVIKRVKNKYGWRTEKPEKKWGQELKQLLRAKK